MIQVAAYCRVSTDKEDQANSFETQQRFFREWIDRNPEWMLQEIYADATDIIGLKQNPTNGRRFSPIFFVYRACVPVADLGEQAEVYLSDYDE